MTRDHLATYIKARMRKEVIYAILAGISIGLFVAFGTWKMTKMIRKTPSISAKKATPNPQNISTLTIDNLKNFDILTNNPKINGLTSPNTDIIVSTQEKDYYTKSNNEGLFEIEFDLPAGISEIKINEQKLILVYSEEFEKYLDENETNKTTAYVGTITDISSGTIQIKTSSGDIKQMSTADETSYINTLKKNIEIKATDLAIGDYIVSMGFINGNKVLHAKRILITNPIQENKIEAEQITIEKLTKTKINDIILPKKWNGPNIKDLEVEQEIYVTGTKTNDKFDLRSIFILVQ